MQLVQDFDYLYKYTRIIIWPLQEVLVCLHVFIKSFNSIAFMLSSVIQSQAACQAGASRTEFWAGRQAAVPL